VWTDCLFVAEICTGCGEHWIGMCPASELTRQRIQAERDAT
jgi:hypothetical protein